jgi:hypothetical protein
VISFLCLKIAIELNIVKLEWISGKPGLKSYGSTAAVRIAYYKWVKFIAQSTEHIDSTGLFDQRVFTVEQE